MDAPLERAPAAPPAPVSGDEVRAFLARFEELAAREDFDLLENLIDERAHFRFNDGDFVGRPAIRAAFERTWRRDRSVTRVSLRITDVVVLTTDARTATATYDWIWEGEQGGRGFRVTGRGTRVVERRDGRLRIVHEHLSPAPRPA